MIAVDTNILLYAHRAEFPQHPAALRVLTQLAEGNEPWGIPVFCLAEFYRVATHPRFLDPPTPPSHASRDLRRLLASPSLQVLRPGDAFEENLLGVVEELSLRGNDVFDAQIVAVCREHGVSVVLTEDRDFKRFRGIRVEHLPRR